MTDPHDRSDRFELIAACDEETLVEYADAVVDGGAEVRVLQAPSPRLVMQQVTEPVAKEPFNLGEVLVTSAEIALRDERGFAMVPGKAEKPALSGAILDAAVESDHPLTPEIVDSLETAAAASEQERRQRWGQARETTVDFEEMEDHT